MARPAPASEPLARAGSPGRAPEVAAGSDESHKTRTLAQLRSEAIKQRTDELVGLIASRGAKLTDLFYILKDQYDPGRFGAGLDPGPTVPDLTNGLIHDPATGVALQKFLDQWIRDPRLAYQIKPIPPLKPTPPSSPTRRDSVAVENSEEVAAIERELIRPEHRRPTNDSPSLGSGHNDMSIDSHPQASTSSVHDANRHAHRRQSSLAASPYPITFRSRASQVDISLTAPLPESPLNHPVTIDPTQLSATQPSPFTPADTDIASKPSHQFIRAYPEPFAESLPPLPDSVVKMRLNVGGLAMKKARERMAAQQNPQAGSLASANNDLYKLGVSKAIHSSVRSLMGSGMPPAGKTRVGGKVLGTNDWNVGIRELHSLRALERIEELKASKSWSLRQLKKHRPPSTQKAHWDYLLDEMNWMAIDFKQEQRWKVASAALIAGAVRDWHLAGTSEERKALQVCVREPRFLEAAPPAADNDVSMVDATVEMEDAVPTDENPQEADKAEVAPAGDSDDTRVKAENVAANDPKAKAVTTSQTDVVRQRRHSAAVMKARAPFFNMSATDTVFEVKLPALEKPGDVGAKRSSLRDAANEMFAELVCYTGPTEPSSDPRQNRRIDESHPSYHKIVNAAHWLEGKPLLVSTLQPSKKRKLNGDWGDMSDIAGEESGLLAELSGGSQDAYFNNSASKPRDSSKRFNPAPPLNADARAAGMEWSPEEDRQLAVLARQYSFNWDLVANVFNMATRRIKSDSRLPWDLFNRWQTLNSQPNPAVPGSSIANQAQSAPQPSPSTSNAPGVAPGASNNKSRRTSTAASQPPAPGLASSAPVTSAAVKKPDANKAQIRHMRLVRHTAMVEATRRAQKRREAHVKAAIPPPVRKVVLTAHETHNQPLHPGVTALDLSKLKAEREKAALEQLRKQEQARLFQQAQQLAMQQQQMQGHGRGAQLPPNVRLPPGAIPNANLQASQAALLQAQRSGQLPPQLQMQLQMQQNQPRPLGQTVIRPPSQGANTSQQGSPPGASPLSTQIPNLPAGIPFPRNGSPLQAPSQSPQQAQMQLSPHTLSMQIQQANPQFANMTPQQQQAFIAQLAQAQAQAQARSASPSLQGQALPQMPGGFPIPQQPGMTPEQQQQQLIALMRMRQNSQGSQGSVQ